MICKSISELSKVLGYHYQTIYKYYQNGLIKPIKDEKGKKTFDSEECKKIIDQYLVYNNNAADRVLRKKNKEKNKEVENDIISIDNINNKSINEISKELFSEEDLSIFFEKYEKNELSVAEAFKAGDLFLKRIELYEKTKKQKIENDEREGKLISRDLVDSQVAELGKRLKDTLFEIPNRLSFELAAISDQKETKIFLNEELTKIFQDFCKGLESIWV